MSIDKKAIEAAVESIETAKKISSTQASIATEWVYVDAKQLNIFLSLAALYLSASEKMPDGQWIKDRIGECYPHTEKLSENKLLWDGAFLVDKNIILRIKSYIDQATISHMRAMADKDKTIEILKAEVQVLCKQRTEKDAEIERLKELQPYKDQIDAIYKLASLAKPETPEARFCETESVEIVNNIQIGRLYAELERLRKIVDGVTEEKLAKIFHSFGYRSNVHILIKEIVKGIKEE